MLDIAKKKFTRRCWLQRSLQAFGMAVMAGPLTPLLAAPASRRFKIGACDWSLGKRADPASLDLAKEIGLDGLQISMGPDTDIQLTKPEVQAAYQKNMEQTGVEVASVAIDAMWQGPLKSDPRAAVWLSDSIDVCKAMNLGVSMICCFDLDPAIKGDVEAFVKALNPIVPKAEREGVVIGLENWLSAEDNLRILDLVGSPNVKVYYDVGNSTDKGRDVCNEIRTLGPALCELHAKDASHMLGQGRIDFREVRKALDAIDYHGWIHIEAASPHGIVPDYTAHAAYLRSVFPPEDA
jgi:L-ribulose-5-phosphate 3-epimerase